MMQQLNELQKQLEQFSQSTKQYDIQINNILYSGNNKDAYGNQIPNPSLHSQTKFIIHYNVGDEKQNIEEQFLRISTSEIWQSMTYPGEYVQIKDDKICKRMNNQRMLIADFDYRFCPVNKIPLIDQFTEKKKILLKQYNNDIVIQNIQYNMSQQQFEDMFIYIKQIKRDNVYTQLRLIQDCLHLLYLTKLKEQERYCEYRTCIQNQTLTKYNIFENCVSNVQIFNSNVYINHIPQQTKLQNIQINNSQDIVLLGNQNINIQNSSNIIMRQSDNQGSINIINGSNYYFGTNFASNGGIFKSINCLSQYIFIEDNVLSSGKIQLIDNNQQQIILQENSCNYSSIKICNSQYSKILVEKESVINSQIKIQKSLQFSYLNIIQKAINNGKLIMNLHCFNTKQIPCVCVVNCRQIIFPINIKYFCYEKYIDSLELLYGTSVAIQGINENGPYNNIIENIRKPQYLVLQQKWMGYQVEDENQKLSEWKIL